MCMQSTWRMPLELHKAHCKYWDLSLTFLFVLFIAICYIVMPEGLEKETDSKCVLYTPLDFEPDSRGLGHLYFTYMKRHGNKVAQYIADTHEEDTYNDLLKRCVRTALSLKKRDIETDDVVIICSYNQKNNCVPFIACTFLKIQVASLDPILSLMDTTHLIKEVKPKLIFVVPEAVELIEKSLQEAGLDAEIVIFGESDKYTKFSDFLQPDEKENEFVPEPVDSLRETAVIFFSSGTTGLPKGIMTSHFALMAQSQLLTRQGNPFNVTLTYASLYWISSVLFCIMSILSGGSRVICETYDPRQTWHLIEKYKITFAGSSPNMITDLIKIGRPDGIDTTSLVSFICGGGSVSEKQMDAIRDLLPGTFVSLVYGQTEVAGVLTAFKINEVNHRLYLHYKPDSSGKPIPGIAYKVVDPETGKLCGPNKSGELRVKTEFVMNGYYGRDNSESFDSEGWLRTGDIVYYDDDQCFFVIDRIKEMLKYKSWHVPPAMIEKVLLDHPAVQRTVVIGIPHEEDGDHPMALVVVNSDYYDKVNPEDIEKYVAQRAPDRMKLRGGVKFVDKIAITPSGKVKRKQMREMVLNGLI